MSGLSNQPDDLRLAAALNQLLPGGDGFPSASDVDLDAWTRAQPRFAPSIDWLLDRLSPEFDSLTPDDQRTALAELEASDEEGFGSVIVAAYSGYYTHPNVLAVIEQVRGYKARPPQPGGYELADFDEAILATPRGRPRSYRDPSDEADK